MDTTSSAFYITMAGLLAVPPIAVATFASIQSWWPSAQSRMVSVCALTIPVILGAAALGFTFKNVLANLACFVIAYGAYCYLAVSCWRITFLPLRIFALFCAAIPVCAGYFLGTVGLLGVMFIVGDYARAPRKTELIDTGLVCRVTDWGMAVGASGYTVSLYKSWNWLPFVERSVVSIRVVETGYVGEPPPLEGASCADAVAKYRR